MNKPTEDKPDFEKLRAERDENLTKLARELTKSVWPDATPEQLAQVTANTYLGGGTSECYCNCAGDGPCEHDFGGWRYFYNDAGYVRGGEQYCKRCGMGAMQHSLATCWD
jgi:hypothetical protein